MYTAKQAVHKFVIDFKRMKMGQDGSDHEDFKSKFDTNQNKTKQKHEN